MNNPHFLPGISVYLLRTDVTPLYVHIKQKAYYAQDFSSLVSLHYVYVPYSSILRCECLGTYYLPSTLLLHYLLL